MTGGAAAGRRRFRWSGLALALCLAAGAARGLELTPLEAAGKRLYREAQSPSGSALSARVGPQSLLVPGASVPCVNCHGADGKGRPEGGLQPPEITWRELSKPYGHQHDSGRQHPAFDLANFYRTVTEGLDPAGQPLNPAMPRYALAQSDVAALVAYLQKIDHDHDPGIAEGRLRIGTVLPRRGPLAPAGELVEQLLRGVFAQLNGGGGVHGRQLELVVLDAEADPAAQLAGADLFALLAPLVPAQAGAVFAAAEASGLPVVGPLAGESAGGRYTFQLSPGEREQGRALAEFAVRGLKLNNPMVAVVAPPEDAGGVAAAVEAQLGSHGWQRVSRHAVPGAAADRAVAAWQAQGVEVLFYFGSADEFAALRQSAAARHWQPVFLAPAARTGGGGLGGPGPAYLALPASPADGTVAGRQAFEALRRQLGLPTRQAGLQAASYAAAKVLVEGLNRVGRAASRERLVDMLENLYAFDTGVTPTVAFGPGRRVGVMGAHVVAADPVSRRLQAVGGFVAVE